MGGVHGGITYKLNSLDMDTYAFWYFSVLKLIIIIVYHKQYSNACLN